MSPRPSRLIAALLAAVLLAATPPTAPPASTVRDLCVLRGVDYHVDSWSFVDPYLVCNVSDQNAGTGKLFKRNANGSFSIISHGGGDLNLQALQYYGVPISTAKALLDDLHKL